MPIPDYPIIKDVKFSDDDRFFIELQSEKHKMLKSFVILLAGAQAASLLLSTNVKTGKDLAGFLVDKGIEVQTEYWFEAVDSIKIIITNQARKDIEFHLNGVYSVDGGVLSKPTGQARKFFKNLGKYYLDVLSSQ